MSAVDYVVHVRGDRRPLPPSEVFVLRQSDVFGRIVLFSYSHLVQTALELDRSRAFLTPEERRELHQLADDIHETAVAWSV